MSAPVWAEPQRELRRSMAAWIQSSIAQQRALPWQGGHDEGNFTSSWFGYHRLTGDPEVPEFLDWLRDGFLAWGREHLVHGYYADGEVHHQPEGFCGFLSRMYHLEPDHRPTVEALEAVARLVGNWVEGVPEWYDWNRHRFRSWRLGTRRVEAAAPWDYETADHFRLIQIALVAHAATGEDRYLELATDYAVGWSEDILTRPVPPAVRLPEQARAQARQLYGPVVVNALEAPPEQSVETHVAGGTISVMLDLFQLTGYARFAEAAKELLKPVLSSLRDPLAVASGALLARYRQVTWDDTFDELAADIISKMPAWSPEDLILYLAGGEREHPLAIGRRHDEVRWARDCGDALEPDRSAAAPALMLAYQITGNEDFAASALAKAAVHLELARRVLPDGRSHGCAGSHVSAVASGHGRSGGIGEVTGALYPLALGAFLRVGTEQPAASYRQPDGTPGLPEGVAALVRGEAGNLQIELYNGRPAEVTVTVQAVGREEAVRLSADATEGREFSG